MKNKIIILIRKIIIGIIEILMENETDPEKDPDKKIPKEDKK